MEGKGDEVRDQSCWGAVVRRLCLQLTKSHRSADVCMLELMNARGRYLSDWKDLLLKADARFQFVGFTRPYGSDLAFIEARWQVDQQ